MDYLIKPVLEKSRMWGDEMIDCVSVSVACLCVLCLVLSLMSMMALCFIDSPQQCMWHSFHFIHPYLLIFIHPSYTHTFLNTYTHTSIHHTPSAASPHGVYVVSLSNSVFPTCSFVSYLLSLSSLSISSPFRFVGVP